MKLYGKNPVLERLKANPQTISRILVEQGHEDHHYIIQKAKKWGIPVSAVNPSQIVKLARNHNTQGIIADVADFQYVLLDDLLNVSDDKKKNLFFLDGIKDPQNLGSIMRALGCLGSFAIVLPTHESVSVTESVLRVASGADNYVSVCQVSNLANALRKTKDAGYSVLGSVLDGGKNFFEIPLMYPLALVLGSEQKGIRDVIRRLVDVPVTIPMSHQRLSLNVAQAASIFAYEIVRQKIQK